MRYGLSGPYWLLDNERGTTTLTTTTIPARPPAEQYGAADRRLLPIFALLGRTADGTSMRCPTVSRGRPIRTMWRSDPILDHLQTRQIHHNESSTLTMQAKSHAKPSCPSPKRRRYACAPPELGHLKLIADLQSELYALRRGRS